MMLHATLCKHCVWFAVCTRSCHRLGKLAHSRFLRAGAPFLVRSVILEVQIIPPKKSAPARRNWTTQKQMFDNKNTRHTDIVQSQNIFRHHKAHQHALLFGIRQCGFLGGSHGYGVSRIVGGVPLGRKFSTLCRPAKYRKICPAEYP